MARIKQLSAHLINQIAAGEVIERPASVVKELTENSIDAGATKISIEITNECRDIRIADNGSGIHPDDIILAFSKHATSKISTSEDLFAIDTLGFRGEALSSIISVAKLTCTTRTKDFETGMKVKCENSEVSKAETGCAVGTIMDVKDLFYNIPVRLKFLKNPNTEFSNIQELVQNLALSHPAVAFELKKNGKTVLKTTGQNNLLQCIKEVFSQEVADNLKEVLKTDELSCLKLSGFVSKPDYTRSSKNTKKEVRYKNTNQIFNFIHTGILAGLSNYTEVPREFTPAAENIRQIRADVIQFPQSVPSTPDVFIDRNNDTIYVNEEKVQPQTQEISVQKAMFTAPPPAPESEENIIGQYKNTYILVEKEDGLEIVDQHIAEERYIYEKLKKDKEIVSQLLFVSDVLEVSASESELIKENIEKFEKFGYGIEFLKDNELIFKKVPQLLAKVNPKEILSDILENIDGDIDGLEEKILRTTACKASVKAGQKLSTWQMSEIIKKWRTTELPYTCPHGRPICKFFPHKELAAFFQRQQ